jgi:hypothetical protein
MLILQALLLWLIASALMVGGAMLFHKFFPEESPWLGYLVPPLAITLLFNFIEHLVALPSLLLLLPLLLAATLWMAVGGKYFQKPLILPTAVFLGSFLFTFGVRCLQPDISYTSDDLSDLNMVNNFLQGQTLPPTDTWLPPYKFEWYYCLQHYSASVLERLLNVKIGVATNVSHCLLDALICVAAAAAAHRLSGQRLAATLALPFLMVCASTGAAAYLILIGHTTDQWLVYDLSTGMSLPHPDSDALWNDPLWNLLRWDPRPQIAHLQTAETLRLQVPGFWTWRAEYHANAAGHLLTIFSVLVVAELADTRRTIWPWVLAVMMPLLVATASAWALPITLLLCWAALPMAWFSGRRPASLNAALWTLFGSVVLIWPAFYNVTSNPEVPAMTWIDPAARTPVMEFIVQWWPIIVLYVCALTCWKNLSFGVRWFLAVIPIMLVFIDSVTIESRYNMIEKMWGYTWAVGLVGLFPVVASQRATAYRLVAVIVVVASVPMLYDHAYNTIKWATHPFKLEGSGYITDDEQLNRLMQVVGQTKGKTFLTGHCDFCYYESPAPAVFTGNRAYSAWEWYEERVNFKKEAQTREKQNNDFYSAAMTDRLHFLQSNHVYGVMIWPGDNISDDALAKLKQELAPDYDYVDCKGSGPNNAGVFILRSPSQTGNAPGDS